MHALKIQKKKSEIEKTRAGLQCYAVAQGWNRAQVAECMTGKKITRGKRNGDPWDSILGHPSVCALR